MPDDSITQEQIRSLLNDVAIEERIQDQFTRVRTKIDRILNRPGAGALLEVKKDLEGRMETLAAGGPYSNEFIESFKAGIKKRAEEMLQITRSYALFELMAKLENLITAMFYDIHQDQRRYPRFPLVIDLYLHLGKDTHLLSGINISSAGLSFYAPVALTVGRRYSIFTRIADGEELLVDVFRTTREEQQGPGIHRAVCTFPDLMPWERIRDIILKAMGDVS